MNNSLNTGNTPYEKPVERIEDNPYYNNSLGTGSSPYENYGESAYDESQISVTTSSNSNCDVVVIIKSQGGIARNAYIKAGGSICQTEDTKFSFMVAKDGIQINQCLVV